MSPSRSLAFVDPTVTVLYVTGLSRVHPATGVKVVYNTVNSPDLPNRVISPPSQTTAKPQAQAQAAISDSFGKTSDSIMSCCDFKEPGNNLSHQGMSAYAEFKSITVIVLR